MRSSSTCPSASMENEYRPSESPMGRDSMRERLTPRVASCSSISSRAPAWLLGRCTTSVVLSAPVRGGTVPGRPTMTKRVTACALSATPSASASSP